MCCFYVFPVQSFSTGACLEKLIFLAGYDSGAVSSRRMYSVENKTKSKSGGSAESSIAISVEDKQWVDNTRGKLSKKARLHEIIEGARGKHVTA